MLSFFISLHLYPLQVNGVDNECFYNASLGKLHFVAAALIAYNCSNAAMEAREIQSLLHCRMRLQCNFCALLKLLKVPAQRHFSLFPVVKLELIAGLPSHAADALYHGSVVSRAYYKKVMVVFRLVNNSVIS